MDKLQLTGWNLDRVFNSRSGCVFAMHLSCFETKLPNLMLKTRPKQLVGSLPLDIVLPAQVQKYWPLRILYRLYLEVELVLNDEGLVLEDERFLQPGVNVYKLYIRRHWVKLKRLSLANMITYLALSSVAINAKLYNLDNWHQCFKT
jgi:hypothetical protein